MSVAAAPSMAAAIAVMSANFEMRKADLAIELASLEMDSAITSRVSCREPSILGSSVKIVGEFWLG